MRESGTNLSVHIFQGSGFQKGGVHSVGAPGIEAGASGFLAGGVYLTQTVVSAPEVA